MIRGTLSWLAIGASLLHAAVGDWQAWTYTQNPVMAAASGTSVWTATSGGVVRYDTAAGVTSGKTTVYTNLDGLASTDLRGIIASGDTLWTTSADGDLCRLLPNAKIWEPMGSYHQSGWSFNPRALAISHGLLFLGGPQGLSIFSTSDNLALDNISSFGSLLNQAVHSIVVERDTIWVGLQNGAAYTVPSKWSQIGRGQNILSDPSRWTVMQRLSTPVIGFVRLSKDDRMRTVPDTSSTTSYDTAKVAKYDTTGSKLDTIAIYRRIMDTTMNTTIRIDTVDTVITVRIIDTTWIPAHPLKIDTINTAKLDNAGWNWATPNEGSPLICTGWNVYWNNKFFDIAGGAVHGTPYNGGIAICVPGQGLKFLRRDGTIQTPTQPVQLPGSSAHHILLKSDGSMEAWLSNFTSSLPNSKANWTSSSIYPASFNSSFTLPSMEQDPDGNLLLATWGDGLWQKGTSKTTKFDHTNSCFQPSAYVIANSDTNYVPVSAISQPTNRGNWIGLYTAYGSTLNQLAFLPKGSSPHCQEIALNNSGELFIRGLASEGDSALWIASGAGINRLRIEGDSLTSVFTSGLPSIANPTWIRWSKDRIYVIANFQIYSISRTNGTWKSHTPTSSNFLSRGYRQIEVDTLGNLWVSGTKGLDIIHDTLDTSFTLKQRIDHSSGLLADEINHFSLDRASGAVAIATPLGVNLYQSPYKIQPTELTASLRPFPNPFRKLQHTKVAFPGVNSSSKLYVYASDGTLVAYQTGKDVVGDQFIWIPKANLRPGVYFWVVSDASSKVMGRLVVGD